MSEQQPPPKTSVRAGLRDLPFSTRLVVAGVAGGVAAGMCAFAMALLAQPYFNAPLRVIAAMLVVVYLFGFIIWLLLGRRKLREKIW